MYTYVINDVSDILLFTFKIIDTENKHNVKSVNVDLRKIQ